MEIVESIKRMVHRKIRFFIIDGSNVLSSKLKKKIFGIYNKAQIDVYDDYKKLIYNLNKTKNSSNHYNIGIIDDKSECNKFDLISMIVKQIDPNIKLFIYTNENSLIEQLSEEKLEGCINE